VWQRHSPHVLRACVLRAAHRDYDSPKAARKNGEKEPIKYWLSTLPEDIRFQRLVDYAKLRWRIERDYLELKQEAGLGDFEGRGWRGFHHHATMSIAVYGFLISERGAFFPSASISKVLFPQFALPESYRPRGSAAAA
jgi:SRSO17 transposase